MAPIDGTTAMSLAILLQVGFVVGFVWRYLQFGTTAPEVWSRPYRGAFTIHQAVSVVATPLVLASAVVGLLGYRNIHREIAPTALGTWVFVSVTGIAVYLWAYARRAGPTPSGADTQTPPGSER